MRPEPSGASPTVGPTAPELPLTLAPAAQAALAKIGRTEDLRFSPDGRRLAIAAFDAHAVVVVGVATTTGPDGVAVALTDAVECSAPGLASPHGLDFLDEDTIVVANRDGRVTVHPLPRPDPDGSARERPAVATMATLVDDELGGVLEPGSVRVRRGGTRPAEILVCDNAGNTVTRHRVVRTPGGVTLTDGEVVLRRWLDIPDSLAVSDDGCWLAVSNHNTHSVLVYRCPSGSVEHAEPAAVLRGGVYPHGLHFTPDADHLVVADAARPSVHVFAATERGWHGGAYPVASHRVMDQTSFLRGHRNPQEGGPKGLDLDPTGRVVAITSEHQPLACFALAALIADPGDAGDRRHLDPDRGGLTHSADCAAELADARIRIDDAERRAAAAEARAAAAEALLHAYQRTRLIRLVRSTRRAYRSVRTRRPHGPGATPPNPSDEGTAS